MMTDHPQHEPVYTVQVVIDAADPHTLADWWAVALRWSVEPQDEAFIHSMIDQGFATEAETTRHKGTLAHHWTTLTDPEGNEFCLSIPSPQT